MICLSRRDMQKIKSDTQDHRKLSVGGWRLAESSIDRNYKSLDRKKSGRNSRQQRNNSGQNSRLVNYDRIKDSRIELFV